MNAPLVDPQLFAGRRALITGLAGQDGYYLARWLLGRGASVWGTLLPGVDDPAPLRRDLPEAQPIDCDLADAAAVEAAVAQVQPDYVYHLAAQSSVGLSWSDPAATTRANVLGTLHLLEAVRRHAPAAGVVVAGSCECYDHTVAGEAGVTAATPFRATNPYAVSKIAATQLTGCWRNEHGLRASVAILFNHTSPRRPPRFVERGIVHQAVRVALGLAPAVVVGDLQTRRDWAWAEDLVEGFALMGLLDPAEDLVLASGQARTTGDWVDESFRQLGLDPARHLQLDPSRLHPGDRPHTYGNIEAARRRLGWAPRVDLPEMVRRLIATDRAALAGEAGR